MSSMYRCGPPLMRCAPCDRVSRVRLVPTPRPDAWLAVCPRCQGVLKQLEKRKPIRPGRVPHE
jgi:hypothetical protein